MVSTFAPDGYLREPIGPHYTHRGTAELRSFFDMWFSAGGGIGLEHCAVTDDGVRCALEYNCVRLGRPRSAAPGRHRRSTNGARTGCWPRPASTTTSKHRLCTPEAAGRCNSGRVLVLAEGKRIGLHAGVEEGDLGGTVGGRPPAGGGPVPAQAPRPARGVIDLAGSNLRQLTLE